MSASQSRWLQARTDYLALEKELQYLKNEMEKCAKKQKELQCMLETNKKKWNKLKILHDQMLKERDQKKKDEQE